MKNFSNCSLKEIEVKTIRDQFPVFDTHPDVVFFDNASTTQKPRSVINTITHFYQEQCSNAGRSAYHWSTQLSRRIEENREAIAAYINANSEDIAFTSGATHSLNLIATSWGLHNLKDGDEILVCLDDHKSTVLPWVNLQSILRRFGIDISIIPFSIHPSGGYNQKEVLEKLSDRTRLITFSHIHHLYGIETDLHQMIPKNVLISLDVSQSIAHTSVDVLRLGVHFVSFSGHKLFAANGAGILWVHPEIHKSMHPTQVGGGIKHDALQGQQSPILAGKIECGTLNLPAILTYQPAIQFIQSVGISNIEQHISNLTHALYRKLKNLPGIEFAPGIASCQCAKGYGIIAFKLQNINSVDLCAYLDNAKIFVRTGDHCITGQSKDDGFARVSLHIYNTLEEIDYFVEVIKEIYC